jgi:hypothetical protein
MSTVILAVGCSTKIKSSGGGSAAARLEYGQKILIVVPADGAFGNTTYSNSGREAAGRLQKALISKSSTVTLSRSGADVQAALAEGRSAGCRYVIHPEITHWEHRVAAWSGLPSRVSFFVTVYDLKSGGAPALQKSLEARGRIMTFKSQFPADIAEAMFQQFANESF